MNLSWKNRPHTLSGSLVMLFIGMTVLMLIIVGMTIRSGFRANFQETIQPHLIQYISYIQNDLGQPPQRDKAVQLAQRLKIEIHYSSDTEQWSSNDRKLNFNELNYHRQFLQQGIEYGFGHDDGHDFLITRQRDYSLAFSILPREKPVSAKIIPLLAILALLVILYHATKRLFAPIKTIQEGISQIGAGDLSYRLKISQKNELGSLAESINEMADDIEQMLEAKRQLLLAISHELRSPLTRARVAAAMIDDHSQQFEMERELNEMDDLIEEILETERLSSRHHILNRTDTNLQQLIHELLQQHFSNQRIRLDLPADPIHIQVDSARIKLLLKNILGNALQHNPDQNQPPEIRLEKREDSIIISIEDFGPGIETEHLPHLMEPFYRTDASRQRQTGGYGLGLYLCKVIAEVHGGQLQIHSEKGHGTTLKLTLPLV